MMIYVVTKDYLCVDSGDSYHTVVGVYDLFSKAQEAMENEMRDARAYFEGEDCEENDYSEGDMEWAIWSKDNYMTDHCDIQITAAYVQ